MLVATVGLIPGYNNVSEPDWKFIESELQKMGQEIPFSYSFKRVIYKREWGCPDKGEHIVEISAMRNPEFEPDYYKWAEKYIKSIERLSKTLKQTTAQIQFLDNPDLGFIYIKNI